MNISKLYKEFKSSQGVCTDTRKLQLGQLFFALKGENFNGNKFADRAIEDGAKLVIIDDPKYKLDDDKYILVDDVLEALQELARHHRKQFKIPIIAITGSNGKTTTKELIRSVLSTSYQTFATAGNLNNHIGVPLSLLSITKDHEMAIIEMGANHPIEINQLCRIAEPNFGLITNIGKAHLEGFGSIEGVAKAKGELFDFLEASNGRIFVNMNDFRIAELAYFIQKATTYGSGKFYKINGEIYKTTPNLEVLWQPKRKQKTDEIPDARVIQTQLTGTYNLDNVIAAIAIGSYFKVKPDDIVNAIESYTPTNKRSQMVKQNGSTYILDAYNANPSSMEAALKNLAEMKSTSKIAMLGDMLELGDYSNEEHQRIATIAHDIGLELLVLVGPQFMPFSNKTNTLHFDSSEEAAKWFTRNKGEYKNSTILIKGSRGIRMERILE